MSNDELIKTHLDLWKYFTDDAAKIKDRMWTIASWMFTLQGALLAFIAKQLSSETGTTIEVKNSIVVLIVAGIGIVLSGYTIFMIQQYGHHISGMWNRADLVRRSVPGLTEIWLLNDKVKLKGDREAAGVPKKGLPPVALPLIFLCLGFMLVFTVLFLHCLTKHNLSLNLLKALRTFVLNG